VTRFWNVVERRRKLTTLVHVHVSSDCVRKRKRLVIAAITKPRASPLELDVKPTITIRVPIKLVDLTNGLTHLLNNPHVLIVGQINGCEVSGGTIGMNDHDISPLIHYIYRLNLGL
jgi:hypothetical protein